MLTHRCCWLVGDGWPRERLGVYRHFYHYHRLTVWFAVSWVTVGVEKKVENRNNPNGNKVSSNYFLFFDAYGEIGFFAKVDNS